MSARHASWVPRVGDSCVDYRAGTRYGSRSLVGEVVTVKTRTDTLVITSDGERYNRRHLTPVSEGRYSNRVLLPVHDPRIACARGRAAVVAIAQVAENLSRLDRTDPADTLGDLAQIIAVASDARHDLIAHMSETSKGQLP